MADETSRRSSEASADETFPDHGADFLRQFLANRDQPCPNCEYNLRALTGGVCPECGEPIVVRVALVEPKQAALIAGLIGLSAGAGLNGLLLIYVLIMTFRGLGPPPSFWNWFVLMNGSGLIVMGAAIYLWLRNWRAIRRKSVASRYSLAAAGWLLTLIDVMVFSFTIR